MYCMYIYFNKLNLFNFLKLSSIIFFLAIPGFLLVYFDPFLVKTTWDSKFYNSVLINSSILSFYLIPIFFAILFLSREKFIFKKNQQISLFLVSVVIVVFLSILFDYNFKLGGGYFLKLSYLILNNNILFLVSSVIGLIILFNLGLEHRDNILLIFLLIFGFTAYMIFQKYFEPMFFFIFFLMIKSKTQNIFLRDIKNIYFLFLYFALYLTSAIINNVYQITKTVL